MIREFSDSFALSGGYDPDEVLGFILAVDEVSDMHTDDGISLWLNGKPLLSMSGHTMRLLADSGPFYDFCQSYIYKGNILRTQDCLDSVSDFVLAILSCDILADVRQTFERKCDV